MPPILFHLYGPIAIHSFGTMIVLGLLITLYLLNRDVPLQKMITNDQLISIFQAGFLSALAGGRIWFLMTNFDVVNHWTQVFAIWSGGLSILGALVGGLVGISVYVYIQKLPILHVLDRLAVYTPLLQSISRLGCFFAGCCYGKPTTVPWAIMYTHQDSLAPLYCSLHPTQIYSSIALACIFACLYTVTILYPQQPAGFLLSLSIALVSLERFAMEYLRGDQITYMHTSYAGSLSVQQIVAITLCVTSCIAMIFILYTTKKNR